MSYRRFLNDSDYLGILTADALSQLTRGDEQRFAQAEQSAEMGITEYLSENCEIEAELAKGKLIANHHRSITFPVGVYIYLDGRIYEVICSMSGYKTPSTKLYWDEHVDINLNTQELRAFSNL